MPTTTRKPRTRKSADNRRDELAAAARAVALEHGLDAVTLRAVAARAGVTPPLVAHYAPGMDEFVADTFGSIVHAELEDVRAEIAREAPPRALAGLVDTLLSGSRDEVTMVWVQSWALASGNEALAARVRLEMDAWQGAIREILVAGRDAGDFHIDDVDEVAWHILAMIDGLGAHSLVRWGEPRGRAALARRSIAALVSLEPDSLGASPKEEP